MELESDFNVTV